MGNQLDIFLSGSIMSGSFVIGLFFFKFWNKFKDRLFLYFAISFWILTLTRLLTAIFDGSSKPRTTIFYVLRLIAFLIILFAIFDKNRQKKS